MSEATFCVCEPERQFQHGPRGVSLTCGSCFLPLERDGDLAPAAEEVLTKPADDTPPEPELDDDPVEPAPPNPGMTDFGKL